ncbi:hypothetical protein CONCODRAFT_20691 [Conidiobolus coronatus NRRL 28638]|uniref:F-box domain-containing protein n=1 Tax=Conidiobolus coronatus (strain ATCC 28846 / CBS 209.66 / NRRL 28638) TaxID=796925 RepID=A0A137NRY5_CONC2|nr:hypothetical protein CONCODRAFT_20691 [Conidiobolus coronatus NRRL 28638]|eukprot:KXN65515.1 hypothetical protein CONCODRAFT_20691 [Conidiobolus coronatus NRRL 28638]
MNAINWNLILQKPEFYEYLPIPDIIQLSFANKLIRDRLKCILFSHFNITRYFNEFKDKTEKDMESMGIESNQSLMDRYLCETKLSLLNLPHKRFIKQLIYNEITPLGFINLSVIEVFSSLINLEFIKIKVPFESILMIFNKLNSLQYLNLHLVSIIKLKNDNYSGSDLIFPPSLKTLKFSNLNLIVSKLDYYPNLLNYDNALDIESTREIYIQPQSLPNLQSFCYFPKISKSLAENTQNYLNFLNLNKNLRVLETLPKYFDIEIVKGLNDINKLTKLKLDQFFKHSKIPNASYPKLNSVSHLSLKLNFNSAKYFEEVCKLFPNVKTLSIYRSYMRIEIFGVISYNFIKLTSLTLKSSEGLPIRVYRTEKFPNLKSIFIYTRLYSYYELSGFDRFPKLTRITIEWSNSHGYNEATLKKNYDKYPKWKYYLYPNKIQCYRIYGISSKCLRKSKFQY